MPNSQRFWTYRKSYRKSYSLLSVSYTHLDVDGKLYPLGGNMRLRAIKDLGMKEIPKSWVSMADEWTDEQRREFIVKDNANLGTWDFYALAEGWNTVSYTHLDVYKRQIQLLADMA